MSVSYVSSNLTKVFTYANTVNFRFHNNKLLLDDKERNRIENYWQKALIKNNSLFNGKVLTVQEIHYCENKMVIDVCVTDYAHLTYVMNHERTQITMCKALAAGALLTTKDDYILLGKMGEKTSFPGIIQCIGGGISEEDLIGEEAAIYTVIRECYEEIGIRIERGLADPLKKYVYIRDKMSTLGFVYIVNLDLSKEEVKKIFRDFKGDINEIDKIIYVKSAKEEIIRFCEENRLVDYLKPVLYDYSNICELSQIKDLRRYANEKCKILL